MLNLDPAQAWQPYRPTATDPWDIRKVGHLYRRATFGATWAELQTARAAGPEKAIAALLAGGDDTAFENADRPLADSLAAVNSGGQLPAWWLHRMLATPHPLREKLTLFWHNHFATSNAKVQSARAMLGQYRTLHRHALGKFGPLLQEISTDPAMLVWLDTNQSKKAQPNENYARELMELFGLGIGHYSEKDIREAARAFTGWDVRDGKPIFDPAQHDDTDKTVFGKTGPFQGKDVVDLCLGQKACAEFIVGKLYRFLISEQEAPTAELVAPLAAQLRKSDYDLGDLVGTMLRSKLFFSPLAYRTRIKSPVEFALGIVRALEGRIGTSALAGELEKLGQRLFYPPSVKGWDGGPLWLNGQTLLTRQNLALALTTTEDPRFGNRIDPARIVPAGDDQQHLAFLLDLLVQSDVPAETKRRLTDYAHQAKSRDWPVYWTPADIAAHRVRALCHLVLALPEYQLA